jgi:tetratricopeptide (TPR) repeat protein
VTNWINFSVLWLLTGSPVSAALILLAVYAVTDWYTFGFLRGLARLVANWRRMRRLEPALLHNPHDRKARADLGEILVDQRRYARAIEVLKPLVDHDPGDLNALYLLGVACLNAGRLEQGELFLSEVHGADPGFRLGRARLEIGRSRLKRRDPRAVEPLAGYVKDHPHTVEGRWLLAQAHALAGDAGEAAAEKERCWREYQTSLPYQRRLDRLWAWRARPSRPVLYGALACAALLLLGVAMKQARPALRSAIMADVRANAK